MSKHLNIVSILSVVLLLVSLPLINNVMYKPKHIITTIDDINSYIPAPVTIDYNEITAEDGNLENLYIVARYSAFINSVELVGVTGGNATISVIVYGVNEYLVSIKNGANTMQLVAKFSLNDEGEYISGNLIVVPLNELTTDVVIVGFDNNVDFSSINP